MYLCSAPYHPAGEHTILATDPALAIEWPAERTPVLSDRDAVASTLAEAEAAEILPTWEASQSSSTGLRDRMR